MKKTWIVLFLLTNFILAQTVYSGWLPKTTLDGFWGLPWGASGQQIKEEMKTKEYTFLRAESSGIIDFKSTYAGKDAQIRYHMYHDKMWQVEVFLEFQRYDVINQWQYYCNEISKKYGSPSVKQYYFAEPYFKGDGYEDQAISLGKGTALTYWEFRKFNGARSNFLICEINRSLTIVITYQNGEMAYRVKENKNQDF